MGGSSSIGGRLLVAKVIHVFADASILLIPFWFLPQRWRWTVFVLLFALPLWCIGSLWYYRFWGELPAINSLLLVDNVNRELFRSTLALFRTSDVLIFIPAVITLCAYLLIPASKNNNCDYSPKRRVKLIIAGATVCIFAISQFIYTRSSAIYNKNLNIDSGYFSATCERFSTPPVSMRQDILSSGWTVGMVKSAIFSIQLLNIHKQLSSSEMVEIQSFIDSSPALALPDSIRTQNSGKNVILIVVESLNAEAITMRVDGQPVAPTMLSMIDAEGTISALDVVTQIRGGGSGDGQLIINTGLLPLPFFSTSLSVGSSNQFIALPHCLNRSDNVVIFGDDASSWNERDSFTSYGFEEVLCNRDYRQMFGGRTDDEALLQYASHTLTQLQQPFFLELLTVSMHVPFEDDNIPRSKLNSAIQNTETLPAVFRNYLTMVNFFDNALHSFIESLKSQGLYDDTILIVVSDHSQEATTLSYRGQIDTPMAFIATNTGVSEKIDRKVGEVDVFSTILDICGSGRSSWKGLGATMLNPALKSAYVPEKGLMGEESPLSIRQQQAYEISENIIRGNYFD